MPDRAGGARRRHQVNYDSVNRRDPPCYGLALLFPDTLMSSAVVAVVVGCCRCRCLYHMPTLTTQHFYLSLS